MAVRPHPAHGGDHAVSTVGAKALPMNVRRSATSALTPFFRAVDDVAADIDVRGTQLPPLHDQDACLGIVQPMQCRSLPLLTATIRARNRPSNGVFRPVCRTNLLRFRRLWRLSRELFPPNSSATFGERSVSRSARVRVAAE